MDGGRIYGGDNDMIALLENPNNNSLWISSPSPSFNETMVNFENKPHQGRKASIKREYNEYNTGEEEFDSNPFQSEKKRRLSQAQVQFLEQSFENENKLEPERKMKLAKDLGLEPRQVAIWFQNRRARYKTKQLEKEYGSLKANYDRLKLDFDSISKERDALQIEVEVLTKKLKQRDEAKNTNPAYRLHSDTMTPKMETVKEETGLVVVPGAIKQSMEESSSAKSDIVDSESPHCTNEEHFSVMEDPIDYQIDFLKVEDDGCYESYDLNLSYSCNFSLGDDQPFWSMLY